MKRLFLMIILALTINTTVKAEKFTFNGHLELRNLVLELEGFYKVKIFAKDAFLTQKIHYNYSANSIDEHLQKVSSLLGTSYYLDGDIYYLDQEEILIKVYDSLDLNISSFKGINGISKIGDKIVVTGTKKQIANFDNVIKKLTTLKQLNLRFKVFDVTFKKGSELGISIEKGLKYSFSWESLMQNQLNPLQTLVMSLEASLVAQQNNNDIQQLYNAEARLISGRLEQIRIGDSFDREIFTVSDEGQKFTSKFEKVNNGILVDLLPFYSSINNQWLINFKFNNTKSLNGDNNNNSFFNVTNRFLFSNDKKFEDVLISSINISSKTKNMVKGIPFLCDIPYIGYLFGVRKTEVYNRVLLLFISKK